MSDKDNGGPAFPVAYSNEADGPTVMPSEGMTMRDYFAAKAMAGMIAAPNFSPDGDHVAGALSDGLSFTDGWRGRISVAAYAMADAMLKAREL